MASLITLRFQGEVMAAGPLAATEERDVAHAAFPMSPPRDATMRQGFRAWKIAPLSSGRTLIATIINRGDVDEYDRPVLRTIGCLLEANEMKGPLRDLTAVWEALADCRPENDDLEAGLEGLERRAATLSIHSSPEAYNLFRSELERSGVFHARVAAALIEDTADLYLGSVERALDLLRPALGLLPLERLHRLHMAIGAELCDYREPILGLAGTAPDSWRSGLLSGLLGLKKSDRSDAAVDFESQAGFGFRSKGPRALTRAIADPLPWPGGRQERERYRILLDCLDGPRPGGGARSPFEVAPELEELRQAVRRLEKLSVDLAKWP